MKKIAVFASGGGTDFQSIIDANACVECGTCAANCPVGAISD